MAWAVFMASGSCPVVPVADESFLTDAAAMDMEDTGTNKYQKLVNLVLEVSFIPILQQIFLFIYHLENTY